MFSAHLSPETATLALAIGLIFSLLCYLITNLSPGGMITPGWLALTLVEDYRQFLLVVGVTLATWGLTLLARRYVILYGKRLFASVVLIGVLLQMGIFLLIQRDFPLLFTNQTLGFIVPGLVAHQLLRQPKGATALCTTVVSGATYVVIISGVLVGLVPSV